MRPRLVATLGSVNKTDEIERHPEVGNLVERAQQLVDSKTQAHDVTMWLQEAQHIGDVLALAVATRR